MKQLMLKRWLISHISQEEGPCYTPESRRESTGVDEKERAEVTWTRPSLWILQEAMCEAG